MEVNNIIVLLLIAIILVLLLKKDVVQQEESKELKNAGPIRRWWPGHLMSNYFPFHVPLRIRRHHRFFRKRH